MDHRVLDDHELLERSDAKPNIIGDYRTPCIWCWNLVGRMEFRNPLGDRLVYIFPFRCLPALFLLEKGIPKDHLHPLGLQTIRTVAAPIFMAGIELHLGDITQLQVDAIVNAANESLLGGGGVDGAIHAAAGAELVVASKKLAPCPAGQARLTPAFNLPADHVIHAVGPIYRDGTRGERDVLRNTYLACLEIAHEAKCTSLAFPCISTGAYRFPKAEACEIAIETVSQWLGNQSVPLTIIFCCFERHDYELYAKRLEELGLLLHFDKKPKGGIR